MDTTNGRPPDRHGGRTFPKNVASSGEPREEDEVEGGNVTGIRELIDDNDRAILSTMHASRLLARAAIGGAWLVLAACGGKVVAENAEEDSAVDGSAFDATRADSARIVDARTDLAPLKDAVESGTARDAIDLDGDAGAHGTSFWALQAHADEVAEPSGVAVDGSGNVYVAATFRRRVDIGLGPRTTPGPNQILLAKFDPSGKPLWDVVSKGYETSTRAIGVDAEGNLYASGTFDSRGTDLGGGIIIGKTPPPSWPSGWIAKYDAAGHNLWSHSLGSALVLSFSFSPDGHVHAAGVCTGPLLELGPIDSCPSTLSSGYPMLLELDGAGALVRGDGFVGDTGFLSMVREAGGTRAVLGQLRGPTDLGGGTITPRSSLDVLLAVFDRLPSGAPALRFTRSYGALASGGPVTGGVAFDAAGNVVFGGNTVDVTEFGTKGPFVAKLDPKGGAIWSVPLAHAVRGLTLDDLGRVLVAANEDPFGSNEAIRLIALDGVDGRLLWSRRWPISGPRGGVLFNTLMPTPIAVSSDGIIFTGAFAGDLPFDTTVLSVPVLTASITDLFLAKVAR
jgi:hypothetical protein